MLHHNAVVSAFFTILRGCVGWHHTINADYLPGFTLYLYQKERSKATSPISKMRFFFTQLIFFTRSDGTSGILTVFWLSEWSTMWLKRPVSLIRNEDFWEKNFTTPFHHIRYIMKVSFTKVWPTFAHQL